MFLIIIIFILLIVCIFQQSCAQCSIPSLTITSGTFAPKGQICSGDLIFEDNFDNFNLEKWQHEQTLWGGGNWEFQWYTNNRSNSYVKDGTLYIKPTLTSDDKGEDFLYSETLDINQESCTNSLLWGCERKGTPDTIINPVKSAKIITASSFSFKYGKVEVKAKTPTGDWLWPAIWMLPKNNNYSEWPNSGEIDILEGRGNRHLIDWKGVNIGTHLTSSTLHWGPHSDLNQFMKTQWEQHNEDGYNNAFHRYQMKWTPDTITFLVDDQIIGSVTPSDGGFWELGNLDSSGYQNPWSEGTKMAPFDQEFYLIFNVAIGGIGNFPDDASNAGGKPWVNSSPRSSADFWEGRKQWLPTWQLETDNAALKIDYVKVWAL